jgi:phage shock protein A
MADVDKLESLIKRHERLMNECLEKARQARSLGNYDLAVRRVTEADNHESMMNYYVGLLEVVDVNLVGNPS